MTYLERVKTEAKDLSDKQNKLIKFCDENKFYDLPVTQQALMVTQVSAMQTYLTVLKFRIKEMSSMMTISDED